MILFLFMKIIYLSKMNFYKLKKISIKKEKKNRKK